MRQHYELRDVVIPLLDLGFTHPQFLPSYRPKRLRQRCAKASEKVHHISVDKALSPSNNAHIVTPQTPKISTVKPQHETPNTSTMKPRRRRKTKVCVIYK